MALTPSKEVQGTLAFIAQDEAHISPDRHAYMPRTPEEAATFQPHAWVLEAMRRAYLKGREDGCNQAQEAMRNAIGVRHPGAKP